MAKRTNRTPKKPALPRAPLPRKPGGPHEDRTKRPWRRRKHRKKDLELYGVGDRHASSTAGAVGSPDSSAMRRRTTAPRATSITTLT